jgi:hypothetical protein
LDIYLRGFSLSSCLQHSLKLLLLWSLLLLNPMCLSKHVLNCQRNFSFSIFRSGLSDIRINCNRISGGLHIYIQTTFSTHEFYHCHYAITDYRSNELLSIRTLHDHGLCGRSRKSFHRSFHCIVSILWVLIIFLCGHVKGSILCRRESLQLAVCSRCSSEIV